MWGRSRCKMGSPDLHEFAAARTHAKFVCLFVRHANARTMRIRVANAGRQCFTASR
jgi:hypothetical protein